MNDHHHLFLVKLRHDDHNHDSRFASISALVFAFLLLLVGGGLLAAGFRRFDGDTAIDVNRIIPHNLQF